MFERATELKTEFRATRRHAGQPLAGRTLAMLFQKPSLRTRVTFEAGMTQLGGHADLPGATDVGLGHARERHRRRPEPRSVGRRDHGPHLRPRDRRRDRRRGHDPGDQRPDRLASIRARRSPTCSRCTSGSAGSRRSSSRSSATATTCSTRWRCSVPALGHGGPAGPSRRSRPKDRIVARAASIAAGGGRLTFGEDPWPPWAAPRSSTPMPGRRWARRPRRRSGAPNSPPTASTTRLLSAAGPTPS